MKFLKPFFIFICYLLALSSESGLSGTSHRYVHSDTAAIVYELTPEAEKVLLNQIELAGDGDNGENKLDAEDLKHLLIVNDLDKDGNGDERSRRLRPKPQYEPQYSDGSNFAEASGQSEDNADADTEAIVSADFVSTTKKRPLSTRKTTVSVTPASKPAEKTLEQNGLKCGRRAVTLTKMAPKNGQQNRDWRRSIKATLEDEPDDDDDVDRLTSVSQVKIVGGEIAKSEDWPWQVSIRRFEQHICGGTLINKRYVLTAAHCFEDKSPGHYTVYLAKSQLDVDEPGEIRRYVKKIIIHAQHNKTRENDNDIALIRVLRPINYGPRVIPACLPNLNEKIRRGSLCYVTGFGKTLDTGGERMLKEAEIPIISDWACKGLGENIEKALTGNMFCAGRLEGGVDSCQGDSGGPLVCENRQHHRGSFVLHGIVSFGWGCGEKYSPGVYVRVANYINWIVANLKRC